MANAVRGEKTFEVDGETYTLQFDINGLCDLEQLMGKASAELVPMMTAGSMTATRAVMWCGLKAKHPDVDLLTAGDLVSLLGPLQAQTLLTDAMRLAFPPAEVGKGKGRPRARPGTGPRS